MGRLEFEAPKSAVITGAASGIGRATALLLAQSGTRLVLLDRDGARLEDTLGAVTWYSDGVTAIECDVSQAREVEAAAAEVRGTLDELSALVCCAGANLSFDSRGMTPEQFDMAFAQNVRSAWHVARELLPIMGRGSSILHIGSIHGTLTNASLFPYGATKSAIAGLSRGMAHQLGPDGIRVNTLSPGWVRTGITEALFSQGVEGRDLEDAVTRVTPARRVADASEIAAIAAFLVSPAASFITGAEIHADGGLSALVAI